MADALPAGKVVQLLFRTFFVGAFFHVSVSCAAGAPSFSGTFVGDSGTLTVSEAGQSELAFQYLKLDQTIVAFEGVRSGNVVHGQAGIFEYVAEFSADGTEVSISSGESRLTFKRSSDSRKNLPPAASNSGSKSPVDKMSGDYIGDTGTLVISPLGDGQYLLKVPNEDGEIITVTGIQDGSTISGTAGVMPFVVNFDQTYHRATLTAGTVVLEFHRSP